MGEAFEFAQAYKEEMVGTKSEIAAKYGSDIMKWPAYIQTGKLKDTGIITTRPAPLFYGIAECSCSYWIRDCNGGIIGGGFVGGRRGTPNKAELEASYTKWQSDVYRACPAGNSTIDLRSLEQLAAGCCPPALETGMLDTGPG